MADQIKPVIQINEGKVGIGTSTPAFPLEVENASTAYVFSETTGAATSSGYRWKTPDSEFAWFSTGGTNSLNLYDYVAGATRMIIDSSGNLKLNAYGAGYLKTDGNGAVTAESGIPGTGVFLPLAGGTLTGAFYAEGTLPTTPGMSGTGIGLGQKSNYAHAQWSGSAGGYIDFAEPNVDWSGRIIYTHSSDSMVFYTATTVVLTLDASQNATFAGKIGVGNSPVGPTVGSVGTLIDMNGGVDSLIVMKGTTASTEYGLYSYNGDFMISRTNVSGWFNTPDFKLNSGNATFAGDVTISTSAFSQLDIVTARSGATDNIGGVQFYKSSTLKGQIFGVNDGKVKIATNGSTVALTLDESQNATFAGSVTTGGNILTLARVGIGTVSPQSFTRVDVRSGSAAGNVGLASYGYNGAGGRAIHGQGYATDNSVAGTSTGVYGIANGGRTIAGSINIGGYFAASGSVNNYAIITGSGNVGINNSTPTFGLDVVGTARVTGNTQFVTQSTTDDSTKVATTAFVKNILAEQPAGLTFLGDWNAATNSPTLVSGGGELASGSSTSLATDKLIDSAATFSSDGITTGTDRVRLVQANGNIEFVVITAVDSDTQLTLASNAVTATGETYIVEASPFLSPEGGYYIVSTTGDEDLNGITDWTSGDWVLIATNNEFQKIDNTSILTGQGAEDKIAKWATSSGNPSVTLASSSITDTGSAVTIDNPTTITGPLTVNIDANDTVFIKSVGTNAAAVFAASGDELYLGGGNDWSVRYPSSNNLAIFDNSNPGIAINTSNMDIGSAGPAADLTSFLNIVSTTAGVNPTLNISCDNVDEASIILSEESGNQGYGARLYYQGVGNNFFNIQIGDNGTWTNRFTIDRFGDVGIGILAPQGKMTVVGATQTINMDLDANSAIGLSVMGVDSNNFNAFTLGSANSQNNAGVARFKYNGAGSTNNYMGFGFYANDDILNVKANGTVGIGLTSPTNTDYGSVIPKLHVYTPGTAGAFDLVGRFQAGNDSNDTGGAILINHSNDRGLLIEGGRGGDGATPDDDAIAHLGLVTSSGSHTRVMTLKQRNQSGSVYGVGIATELPQTKLHIGPLSGGDGTAQERLRLTGDYTATNSGALLRFTNQHNSGSNPNTGEYNLAGIIGYDYQSDWGGAIGFQTAPSSSGGGNLVTRMTIDQFGDVGIGTSNPGAQLEVMRDGGAIIRLHDPGNNSWKLKADTDFHIYDDSSSDYFKIANLGNITFGAYGAGTLVTDANGNITASSGGGAGGPYLPLAGGAMTAGAVVTFGNSANSTDDRLKFGASNELQIFHTVSGSFINNTSDNLWLQSENAIIFSNEDGTSTVFKLTIGGNAQFFSSVSCYGLTLSQDIYMQDRYIIHTGDTDTKFGFPSDNNFEVNAYTSTFSSGAGANGDCVVVIKADTDNAVENSNPILKLTQDGGSTFAHFGLNGDADNTFSGAIANAAYIRSGLDFQIAIKDNELSTTFLSGGNVGIGTNNPLHALEVYGSSSNIAITNTAETDAGIIFRDSGGLATQAAAIKFNSSDQKLKFFVNDEVAQRMVIDTNGYVGINTANPNVPLDVEVSDTGSSFNDGAAQFSNITTASSGGSTVINVRNNYGGGFGTLIKFFRTSTSSSIANISFNAGGTAVNYNTGSDYRLKEDLKTFDGLDIVDNISVYNYKWKGVDFRGYGVLAHELASVFPDAVTGEKDAEEMQSVDYSKLVPVLIKSMQELKKEIEELKKQLNA